MDEQSSAHTKWKCKYHIVLAPKYRRQVIYGKLKPAIGKILREKCERKGVEILGSEVCPDHVHMLVSIPPKLFVSSFMGYLKGKLSDDIRPVRKSGIQIWEPAVLVPWLHCMHSGKEQGCNRGMHHRSTRNSVAMKLLQVLSGCGIKK